MGERPLQAQENEKDHWLYFAQNKKQRPVKGLFAGRCLLEISVFS
jgi:hypothetical protein